MEILLEIALVLMLAATLVHAVKLERALGVLKRDRAELQELVDGFNASTRSAEQSIERLRAAADGSGRLIGRQTELATGLKDDLVFLIERGERLADQLDALVRASRSINDQSRSDVMPSRFVPGRIAAPPPAPVEPALVRTPDAVPEARMRSQAERDLLRALRVAR